MNFTLIPAIISGYAAFYYLSHPHSKFSYKIPEIKITKRLQLSPAIRLFARGRVIHLHHWFNCTLLLLISIYVSGGLIDSTLFKGLMIGGMLQGLSFPQRRLVYTQKDSQKNFHRDTFEKPSHTFPNKPIV
ncbi:MAG: hypothetical protein A3D26_02635 [Candidatus Blackburnbacteria bacterium RIFCSPHIGHO2_02_FULL_44_20]|uniref:Uncharacterized protein n=1 Tax=Candidatus Blackburnbacteria bacterium RIFCSPHIGHO2_02_FULL_44_20 TaxID=1797516 RepID=A0A1G1V7I9_9BACT|nr:MAG: hypothetical protein A3E16_03440 [Candidatus Blackburnbacteria bacterium RIFCSPHIGHO2_12_FULL_44_25]OGY11375.1 MAG: hypothetical protein A3D26_02635 [Candidatus Blackburnbacteria bacterium RIFCSPHIGHO2_02_FULL_44_20]